MNDKYEISLWEDYHVAATDTVPAHYEERKIAIIGANGMASPCRAYNPKLVQNVNGTNTFSFEMYMTYKEDLVKDNVDETFDNPFLPFLVNERKVKVLWKNKWYDFIIKKCAEDSSSKKITYTCQDLYINELSKNGYDLEFDSELNNNYGTAQDLVTATLKGTEWQLRTDESETIYQKKEEPVYEHIVQSEITAINESTGAAEVKIPAGELILVFYEQLNGKTSWENNISLQFAYNPNGYVCETNSQRVVDADCYRATFSAGELTNKVVSTNYRAERLVQTKKQVYDPISEKYCSVLTDTSGNEIYEFVESEYNDALIVQNLFDNSEGFVNSNGWSRADDGEVTFGLYYEKTDGVASDFGTTSLRLDPQVWYYNSGLTSAASKLPEEGFVKDKIYIFRYKARLQSYQGAQRDPISVYYDQAIENPPKPELRFHVMDGEDIVFESGVTDDPKWVDIGSSTEDHYLWMTLKCQKSISKKQIQRKKLKLGVYNTNAKLYRWVEDIQFCPEVKNDAGDTIYPNDIDTSSVVRVLYRYYDHTAAVKNNISSYDEIDFLYSGTEPWSDKSLSYVDNNFEKKRSITVSKSNRFNILQTIAEEFECWMSFEIEHDQDTGKTIYKDGTPQKYVKVRQDVGEDIGFGFVYGIDLKSISRDINSDQIVSKTLVLSNNNEYAPDGYCAISSSDENYPGIDFILNFDYYISQGLLNSGEVNNDLYASETGYYTQLHNITSSYKEKTSQLVELQNQLIHAQSALTPYSEGAAALKEQIADLKSELVRLSDAVPSSQYSDKKVQTWIGNHISEDSVYSRVRSIQVMTEQQTQYENNAKYLTTQVQTLEDTINQYKKDQEELTEQIKNLHQEFFNKYSHYIQEGTWTSEDYVDSTLYYLDAQSIAYTSSRPQISYNISVLRLSALEGFENKIFNVGDISYVEDIEFFGYQTIDGVRTPYKEKVIISEVTSYFDDPSKDSFTVQNYKTQFEDLFQRITSTTQSLQYASSSYAKAASIVNSDGTIKGDTLQNSIALNENLVFGAKDESVIWDNTGITVSDKSNSLKKVRLTSGGLFISIDGGVTWKNAVRGEGISTQYLTAGTINVGEIIIMNENMPSFRWDADGINAFSPSYNIDNELVGYDQSTYVRFDGYGIYGISQQENFVPIRESDIYDKAKFGLTWNRFFMKNSDDQGAVEVSTDNDIQVLSNATVTAEDNTTLTQSVERIKIGRLGTIKTEDGDTKTTRYGIRISNEKGKTTLVTGDDGELWIQNRLEIGDGSSSKVSLGYFEGDYGVEVFNANHNFVVYEDGSVRANDGIFTGEINATSGYFGNQAVKITDAGLTVTGGGLVIQDENGKPLLESEEGNLSISGIIEAIGGTIGGFTIEDKQLVSSNAEGTKVVLNGADGSIEADNITLGSGAKIKEYIQLGTRAKIYGATDTNKVLETYADDETVVTSLLQDGSLTLGEKIRFNPSESTGRFGGIVINGANSTASGDGWSITPLMATFNNIDLGTGTIHAARFEINQTQLVGGSMIFKQAYSGTFIKETEKFVFTEEQKKELGEINLSDHWVIFTSNNRLLSNGACYKVSNYEEGQLSFESLSTLSGAPDGIIDLGLIDNENTSWTITVNSETGNLGSFGASKGLTISEFSLQENNIIPVQRLFMGDLTNFKSSTSMAGVGLYCDNVYLNGELTTVDSKAGIRTTGSNAGDHVIWAGATEEGASAFYVTRGGEVYAAKGFFTEATIEGSNIYAANIYGGTRNAAAALNIHDTTKGIVFYDDSFLTTGGESRATLGINKEGLYAVEKSKYVIKLANAASSSDKIRAQVYGDDVYTNLSSASSNRLHLTNNYIYGCGADESHTSFEQLDGEAIRFGVKPSDSPKHDTRLKVTNDNTTVYGVLTLNEKEVNSNVTLAYKVHKTGKIADGYDLYVS